MVVAGLPTKAPKFEPSPSFRYHSHQNTEPNHSSSDQRPNIGAKISLMAFRQFLPKISSVAYIFSFIIITYLKKRSLKLNP